MTKDVDDAVLTSRYVDAVAWAAELHASQVRKGTAIPYLSHLLAVSGLVLEHGGSEDQAIAGLLHDTIEDCDVSEEDIEGRFGSDVARDRRGLLGHRRHPKPPWLDRKEAYLAHLRSVDADVLLVSLADKVHNVRTLAEDVDAHGEPTLERFKGGASGTRWYYRRLADVYEARVGDLPAAGGRSLLHELLVALDRLGATPDVAAAYEAGIG